MQIEKKSYWKHWGDGPAIAAMISAGIGCAVIGIATVLSEINPTIKDFLNWWSPAGPLSGKTGIGIIFWILSWLSLHLLWLKREFPFFNKAWRWMLFLIFIGLLGTFPPFFELFSGH